MDAVIPYVNGCEKVWREEFNKYSFLGEFPYCFFYDWGTLKYVLRGIYTYMPFINNVFLLVSNIEQVPQYVNQEQVKVILHKDFIPEKFLPTFNSSTIEMFLQEIPGLDNEFVYFNDDTIPIAPIALSDLVSFGNPRMNFISNYGRDGSPAQRLIKESFYAALRLSVVKDLVNTNIIKDPMRYDGLGVSIVHGPCVFIRDKMKEVYAMDPENIENSITKFRNPRNLNQYMFSDMHYISNTYSSSPLNLKYVQTNKIHKDITYDSLFQPGYHYLCINDMGRIDDLSLEDSTKVICGLLDEYFTTKCKYEL